MSFSWILREPRPTALHTLSYIKTLSEMLMVCLRLPSFETLPRVRNLKALTRQEIVSRERDKFPLGTLAGVLFTYPLQPFDNYWTRRERYFGN